MWRIRPFFRSFFGILVGKMQNSKVTSNNKFWKSRLERENAFYREGCQKSFKKEYDFYFFLRFPVILLSQKKSFYQEGCQKMRFTKKIRCYCFCCCSSLLKKTFRREGCQKKTKKRGLIRHTFLSLYVILLCKKSRFFWDTLY